jgi:hypothetical protein
LEEGVYEYVAVIILEEHKTSAQCSDLFQTLSLFPPSFRHPETHPSVAIVLQHLWGDILFLSKISHQVRDSLCLPLKLLALSQTCWYRIYVAHRQAFCHILAFLSHLVEFFTKFWSPVMWHTEAC